MERFQEQREQEIPEKDFSVLLAIVDKIEALSVSKEHSSQEIVEWSKELIKDLLEHIRDDLHLELFEDVSSLYKEMNKENLLARVESVKRVIECLATEKPIIVGEGDTHYANSVTSDLDGLRIAMSEAEALGPVRLLVGLDLKALVGFQNDHAQVSEIDDNEFDLRDTTLRKAYCRHVSGEIQSGDIKYMVMRFPRAMFPAGSLSDLERKQKTPFVFRGLKILSKSDVEIEEETIDLAA